MHKALLVCLSLVFCLTPSSPAKHTPPRRPPILGIAGVTLFVSRVIDAHTYYRSLVDPDHACHYCENGSPQFLFLPTGQRISFQTLPSPPPASLLAEVAFLTNDLDAMKRYLNSRKADFDEIRKQHTGELVALLLKDPEGHHISFTDAYHLANAEDLNAGLPPRNPSNLVRIIHAGFVVNYPEAINRFYVDLLGFHAYWHGGMGDGKDDWIAMQVPDGTDWLEYMLNIPANADQQTLGVMNHISLGVPSVRVLAYDLARVGVKEPDKAQIGRDGKWQLNLYDAAWTRIEFMEFKPVQKPCCSEFTGPHPEPRAPSQEAPLPPGSPP